MKNIILHIGFPKTGTTTLQLGFFAKHKEILYLGGPFNDALRKIVEVDILGKDQIEFDVDSVKKVLEEEISKRSKNENDKPVVFSRESISITIDNRTDRVVLAERLFNIFGSAKIIIVIRNQFSFLSSKYIETVKGGMYISFSDFLETSWSDFHRSLFPQLKYYEFIDVYNNIFGEENVLVLCYEDLKNAPDKFMTDLSKFIGISNNAPVLPIENRGLSKQTLFLRRIMNRIVTYDMGQPRFMPNMRPPGGSPSRKNFRYLYKVGTLRLLSLIDSICQFKNFQLPFSEKWVNRIKGLYSESNKKLYEKYKLPLKEYSYPMME